ncbi:putative entry exclusion protein TrbK-alt [Mesorhizobium sp. CO1-1-8]|uniref:putative entry exclusion protein TrbK-alt n=1 Tax=Mesorhizobium sp. CO1-1-8 TaxID=2876631 RepID=UPI001CD063EA|nr:putative entry exclusion protein TrbK-alt [Mesorhizobium sp. CO1-1-8]MBZ9775158.1 putative entry exclusion protein TrbK-alt [Mesorhizobium sp. CO1-1-8]
MDGRILARLVAVVFVAVAVTATAIEMTRREKRPDNVAPQAPTALASNPLNDGLRQCQTLGEAALRDSGCLRLWAEQRDRFLGLKAPFANSASGTDTAPSPDASSSEAK